ncbi:hypothetical protein RHGRI_008567 [Rhododendron griersonianum]|uniref:Uncharacterized protein n=1 Tax=Rhododendron griersonianum TaxID=479676 RepID=A0AAV6L3Y5_9ERIC|nr:hypothetical protein RHGRI_008567 [Rhododendron griersonianum]
MDAVWIQLLFCQCIWMLVEDWISYIICSAADVNGSWCDSGGRLETIWSPSKLWTNYRTCCAVISASSTACHLAQSMVERFKYGRLISGLISGNGFGYVFGDPLFAGLWL